MTTKHPDSPVRGSITLRPLQHDDLDAVMAIDTQSYATVWPADLLRSEIDLDERYHLVAVVDGAVVGHGSLMFVAGEATLTTVAVDPARRSLGIGALIVAALLDEARRRDTSAVTLEVRVSNAHAIALYERFGFGVEGRRKRYYEPDGEDALIMWRRDEISCDEISSDEISSDGATETSTERGDDA